MGREKGVQSRENIIINAEFILNKIRARIVAACERVGRNPNEVLLIGASKTVPTENLQHFLAAGLRACGENYVQEGIARQRVLAARFPQTQWHLIGALQTNKAREAVAHFEMIHSVDRVSLLNALDKEAAKINKIQNLLLQVNLGAEAGKAGCAIGELSTLAAMCCEKKNLKFCGLMCLPPFDENPETRRPYFRELRRLRDEIANEVLQVSTPLQLSMGMSHDFEIALEEGATMIRLGTALFGAREKLG